MTKKIKLTEEQLKTVLKVVKEQSFDSYITKYQDERNKQVSLSQDDAELLVKLAIHWCEGKDDHPDCDEVRRIRSKLNMF